MSPGREGAGEGETPRTVVLHYHLFKCAGTSVDAVLQRAFPGRWRTREFERHGGDNSAEVAAWIAEEADARAFSSHTMVGPVPHVPGVRLVPFVMLREPVARILSAYLFERSQDADTLGARAAGAHDLAGYVAAQEGRSRQCRNFQTSRLATHGPGSGDEFARATAALDLFPVVGAVERFAASMARLGEVASGAPFPSDERRNASPRTPEREALAADPAIERLRRANRDDARLHAEALRRLDVNGAGRQPAA